jgi:LysR family transcriptional regulator, glycine cleavage system transcriptional activator
MKRNRLPLTALRAFEAAARLGRMSSAATELGVTHGAISRQVRDLEKQLGITLLGGSRHRPVLTERGQTLLPTLTQAFDTMGEALDRLKSARDHIVEVRCLGTFMMRWLIPRLIRFNAINPEIDVRLATLETAAGNNTPLDVTITVTEGKGEASPAAIDLFEERLGVVIAPRLMGKASIKLQKDLSVFTMLQTRTRPDAWQSWYHLMDWNGAIATGTAFAHYYFTLEAAISGLGICVAPEHLVQDDIRHGRLNAPFGFKPSGLRYVARVRPNASQSVDVFCTWLEAEAKSFAGELNK